MKNLLIISFLCVLFLFSAIIFAANDKKKEVPPWMEDIKIKGRSTYLVPKGAKREIIGSHVVVEPPSEYVARRIYEIELFLDEKFAEIEKNQDEIKLKLQELKDTLNAVKKEKKDQLGQGNQASQE